MIPKIQDWICLALFPGGADALEQAACAKGNLAWYGVAKGLKDSRNTLYASVALTALGTLGATYLSTKTALAVSVGLIGLGTVGAAIAASTLAKRLSLVKASYSMLRCPLEQAT